MTLTLRACVTQISADAFSFAPVHQNFTVCYLPIMFAGGKPTSLEKILEEELEVFVPFMILCSFNHPLNSDGLTLTVNRSVEHIFSGPKPPWWLEHLPFRYPVKISKEYGNKFAVLKSLVCRCYTYYDCEYILRICAELAEESSENLQYRNDDENMISLFNNGKFLIKFWKENMLYDSPSELRVTALASSDSENNCHSRNAAVPASTNTEKQSHQSELEKLLTGGQNVQMKYIESQRPPVCSTTYSLQAPQNSAVESPSSTAGNVSSTIQQHHKKTSQRIRRQQSTMKVQESDTSDSEPSTSHHSPKKKLKLPVEQVSKQGKQCQFDPSPSVHKHGHSSTSVDQQIPVDSSIINQPLNEVRDRSRSVRSTTSAESVSQESVLSATGLTSVRKRPVLKKRPVSSLTKNRSKQRDLSKRSQMQIFQNVPLSSDLGRETLKKVKPFAYTDYHRDKIERYVNNDNHASVFRRSDVAVANAVEALDSSRHILSNILDMNSSFSSASTDEHDPITVPRCSTRLYRFPRCRKCKLNQHREQRKCVCLSGSAQSKINFCFVQLDALTKAKLDSLKSKESVESCENVRLSPSQINKSSTSVATLKEEIEVIDLTEDSEMREAEEDNDVIVLGCVSNSSFSSLKNYPGTTSDNQGEHSKRNTGDNFERSNRLTKNNFRETSSDHVILSSNEDLSFEHPYRSHLNPGGSRQVRASSTPKNGSPSTFARVPLDSSDLFVVDISDEGYLGDFSGNQIVTVDSTSQFDKSALDRSDNSNVSGSSSNRPIKKDLLPARSSNLSEIKENVDVSPNIAKQVHDLEGSGNNNNVSLNLNQIDECNTNFELANVQGKCPSSEETVKDRVHSKDTSKENKETKSETPPVRGILTEQSYNSRFTNKNPNRNELE